MLRIFGARVSWRARVYGTARIWYPPNLEMADYACLGPGVKCYCMGKVKLHEYAIVSQGAYLCGGSHDINVATFPLVVGQISILERGWVAAEAFVGPGVTVGRNAVLGARGVLFKDADAGGIYVGNPAKLIGNRKIVER